MKSKILCVFIIVTTLSCFFFSSINNAETLEEQKTQAQEKREKAEEKLEYVTEELGQSLVKIQEMDDKIREAEQEISNMDVQLEELQVKVTETEEHLKIVQESYNKNKKLMENRLVAMYENGEVSYLDLLFHSSSLVEFLSNYYMAQEIMQSDSEILKIIEKEKADIEESKQKLDIEKTQLKLLKIKQEQTRIIMENNKVVLENSKVELSQEEKELQQKIQEYKDEEARIESLIQLAANNYEYTGEYTGGVMLWPIAKSGTYITSGYGSRTHPIQGITKFHTGLDIGNAGFGAPVIASADGIVTLASYYGGYGNCVMINHGNGISTLYGHGQKILTEVGKEVKKGDLIMEVGSTGASTGPHLHFEVRINGQHTNPVPFLKGATTITTTNTNTNTTTENEEKIVERIN